MVAFTESRDLGDRSLYDFLIALRRQARQELIEDTRRFENAKKLIADENVNLIEVPEQKSELQCHCNGQWFLCAQKILAKNGIDYKASAKVLKTSLEKGRQKYLNIMLHGPADCGKTFLLKPGCSLFPNVFMNPASSTFGWMGVEKSNLIFLNDLRWAPRGIQRGNIDW